MPECGNVRIFSLFLTIIEMVLIHQLLDRTLNMCSRPAYVKNSRTTTQLGQITLQQIHTLRKRARWMVFLDSDMIMGNFMFRRLSSILLRGGGFCGHGLMNHLVPLMISGRVGLDYR